MEIVNNSTVQQHSSDPRDLGMINQKICTDYLTLKYRRLIP